MSSGKTHWHRLFTIRLATKRIQARIQFGYNFNFIWIVAVNLAVRGSNPIKIHFLLSAGVGVRYIRDTTLMRISYLSFGIIARTFVKALANLGLTRKV